MKTNKKLLASAMALGLAGLTTVGSTYAWFTTSGSAKVTGITMGAQSADLGILIADPDTDNNGTYDNDSNTEFVVQYKNNIDLSGLFGKDPDHKKLSPCTSINGRDFYALTTAKYVHEDNSVTSFEYDTANPVTSNEKYVVTKELFVAVDPAVKTFKLTAALNSTTLDNDISKAARFSVSYKVKNGGESVNPPFSFVDRNVTNANDAALKNFNDRLVTPNGYAAIVNKKKGINGFTASGNDAADNEVFDKLSAPVNKSLSLPETTKYDTWTRAKVDGSEANYEYFSMTLRFWIEGNDAACFNKITEQTFGATLTFAAENTAA